MLAPHAVEVTVGVGVALAAGIVGGAETVGAGGSQDVVDQAHTLISGFTMLLLRTQPEIRPNCVAVVICTVWIPLPGAT